MHLAAATELRGVVNPQRSGTRKPETIPENPYPIFINSGWIFYHRILSNSLRAPSFPGVRLAEAWHSPSVDLIEAERYSRSCFSDLMKQYTDLSRRGKAEVQLAATVAGQLPSLQARSPMQIGGWVYLCRALNLSPFLSG